MPKQIHLLGLIQHSLNSHVAGMWRHRRDKAGWDYARPRYWQHLARTLERGMFDALLITDQSAPDTTYQASSDAALRQAVGCPSHEPSALVPVITTATEHLGVGLTLSTAFEHPYSMSRRLSTLDHLSAGRIAWDIAGSPTQGERDAYGLDPADPAERDGRLEEYLGLCYQLWDSWEADAVIADRQSGVYADPAKVAEVHHEGRHFRSHARHSCTPSPQGRPMLWHHGSAERDRDIAARHAEAVLAVFPSAERMRRYTADLDDRVERSGRKPGSVKVIASVETVVADTRQEALDKYARIKACTQSEGALAYASARSGADLSAYDPDTPVADTGDPAVQALFEPVIAAKGGGRVSVREAAMAFAQGMGAPAVVGTPADVVDQLEHYTDEGGADGFLLTATYTPGCFQEFVDLVVPELQRRGRLRTAYRGATLRENLTEN